MTNLVLERFAQGYALATASQPYGLTERARRACRAAVQATETVPAPGGLPSLLLGQLEGIWAIIYGRREAIEKMHAGAFKKILEAISKLDWQSIVDAVGTQLLIDPGISGDMLAGEIRTRIQDLIAGSLPAVDRDAWRSVMAEALTDGTAEGQTAATAILAHSSGVAIDWELEAKAAQAALAGGQALGDQADLWIQRQTHGLGYQLSQKLASLWNSGASKQELLQTIIDTLGTDKNIASALLDTAIGQALSQGALNTYAASGIAKADFVSAGDGRVCAVCASAEDASPYNLDQCPQPPMHVRCRCTVAPSDVFPSTLSLVGTEDA